MSVEAIGGFGRIEGAIRKAAVATGVDFGFLLGTARRESGLNPQAKAQTSSAAGLFQFVEQTWLSTLKRYGAQHGLGAYADLIGQGSDGRWRVSDPQSRKAVMDLRMDPHAASLMAAEMASEHAAYLKGRTGRAPSAGELYAAHFLGPAGSAKLIEAVQSRPEASAASLFPEAAQANRSIFFHGGRATSVAELYAELGRKAGAGVPAITAGDATPASPAGEQDVRAFALAQRLDRLRRDRDLLGAMNGEGAFGSSLIGAQLLGAFAPEAEG